MASIGKEGKYIKVRWDGDDWTKGLLPQHTSPAGSSEELGDGFSTMSAVNPYRFPGYLSPGFAPDSATNESTVDATIRAGVIDNLTAYLFGGSKILTYTVATNTLAGSATATIGNNLASGGHSGHTTFTASDAVRYTVSGTDYIFYSWNDNTDGDIGTFDLSSTFVDNYWTNTAGATALSKDYEHPMIVGDDNILYIGNGKDLASLQSDGTDNDSALDLPTGYEITSFAKTSNYLVIYAHTTNANSSVYRSESTAFFWDYRSESFTYAFPIQGNRVDGGFTWNGVPHVFAEGRGFDGGGTVITRLMRFNGGGFEPVTMYSGSAPIHNGVEVTNTSAIWNAGGVLYQFGAPFDGFEDSLQKIGACTGSSSGFVRNFFTNQIVTSSGAGASGGLERFSQNYAPGSAETGQKQLPASARTGYRIELVRVDWKDTISAEGIEMQLQVQDRENITTIIGTAGSSPTISTLSTLYSLDSSGNELPEVADSIGLLISWQDVSPSDTSNAPIPKSIEVYLAPITINES